MAQRGKKKPGARARKAPGRVGANRHPARTSSVRQEQGGEGLVRLNKFLADAGIASRRACDELIEAGKVSVDGDPVTQLGTKVDPTTQEVEIDGVILRQQVGARRYYLLNKPSGVLCTNEKRETRPRAVDLITDPNKGRIYTVGRLDEDSEGLIILTSDGDFAQRVAHPSHGISKTYRVRVQGKIEDEALQKVREGVHLSEGKTGGARILVKRRTVTSSTLEVTIREGKNREVRRIFARVGNKVTKLERIRIGGLDARGLPRGRFRALSREEVEAILEPKDQDKGPPERAPQRRASRRRRRR